MEEEGGGNVGDEDFVVDGDVGECAGVGVVDLEAEVEGLADGAEGVGECFVDGGDKSSLGFEAFACGFTALLVNSEGAEGAAHADEVGLFFFKGEGGVAAGAVGFGFAFLFNGEEFVEFCRFFWGIVGHGWLILVRLGGVVRGAVGAGERTTGGVTRGRVGCHANFGGGQGKPLSKLRKDEAFGEYLDVKGETRC